MISYISHVMTLANSIIGVSVLAMPFCFKQCGIILSIVVLILCSLLSRMACHFLIKSAVMSRRRNYEFLAFHAFGPIGKILVELLIIGFLIGTCIAFFVVVGDLGPQIIGKLLNKNPEDIKLSFLLITALFIILPLGLLKNIESLASICTVAIGFYLCLVIKVVMESLGHIFTGDWYDDVNYWRPAGILQCLPIFSMALFCQTQLFEIYESIPNVSLEKMNVVVRGAINICTLVYISVGFFGYVAFCTQSFSGNILMSFEPSMISDVIKIGFVLSVIASFPLVIFPCRASLNSLLFPRIYMHESVINYIPKIRFRCLTFTIITVSLITGFLMPNIEFVLGLVGSTIGVLICLIFPAAFFIAISTKNTNERLIAQTMLFIGMWIMILGTYASIYSVEEFSTNKIAVFPEKPSLQMNNIQLKLENHNTVPKKISISIEEKEKSISPPQVKMENILVSDHFPVTDKLEIQERRVMNHLNLTSKQSNIRPIMEKPKIVDENVKTHINNFINSEIKVSKLPLTAEEKLKVLEEKEKNFAQQVNEKLIHHSDFNSDAIRKEESEIAAAADQSADAEAAERLNEKLRLEDTLVQHKLETMELMKEQKAILQNVEEQKKELEMDKKLLKNLKSNQIGEDVSKKFNKINVGNNKGKPLTFSTNNILNNGQNESVLKIFETNKQIMKKTTLNQNLIQTHQNVDNKLNNFNISLDSRSPILNALINKTIEQATNTNFPLNKEKPGRKANENDSNTMQYAVPIALKLINQTKEVGAAAIDSIKTLDESPIIHRNILGQRAREKRDVGNDLIENIRKNRDNNENNDVNQQCTKNESPVIVKNSVDRKNITIAIESTTEIIIKTNAYLSDEKFVYSINKLNSNSLTNIAEYQIVKKRDLKSLNLEGKPKLINI